MVVGVFIGICMDLCWLFGKNCWDFPGVFLELLFFVDIIVVF